MIDPDLGGIRGAPKFPNTPMMTTLWLSWRRDGRSDHRDAVLHSLRMMVRGGKLPGRPGWIDAAHSAFRFVAESTDAEGRLARPILGTTRLYPAMSADLTLMIYGETAIRIARVGRSIHHPGSTGVATTKGSLERD